MSLIDKIFGDYSSKQIKKITPTVDKIESLAGEYASKSDEELRAMTDVFRKRLSDGETLDDILPEAFAAVREAATRVIGKRPFRVQLMGGIILHQGRIAEMKTGEGKTLVATMPAYLNALTGKGVHIVTVNDYLARRDSEEMGKVFAFLGLTTGLIVHDQSTQEKKRAYACDITYGTNNEIGFDYLRDNMVIYKDRVVQRGHNFAIVDEVDSILIDEARTPLIISGQGNASDEMYGRADTFVRSLRPLRLKEMDTKNDYDDIPEDYIVDEKGKRATLTKNGIAKAEKFFGVENYSDIENTDLNHYVNQALHAHGVKKIDVDYVVMDGKVLIIDSFTGRIMPGRRFSDGLHQAIEAKERVKIQNENQTLATITFQNFFRLYGKLSGMTGTALTEESEFREIYSLDVVVIPTNKPMIREDRNDLVYKSEKGKYEAIIEQIKECHKKGQPVLVGTISVDKSEHLSTLLKHEGIKHNVLNAKYHEKEAEIIAQAGKYGSVTISTNMAGRGTDIMLGGNAEFLAKNELKKLGYDEETIVSATGASENIDDKVREARKIYREKLDAFKREIAPEADKVREAGGLFILGTERHESRRIDNQLRGRSGRQGDPGHSQFFLSAEDDLLRLFAGDRFYNILNNFKAVGDMPIEAGILSKSIESAQKKVEANNFATRRNVLEFDDVMNEQRKKIYSERNQVLDGADLHETIQKMINDYFDSMVQFYCPSSLPENEWNLAGMKTKLGWIIGSDSLDELKTPDDYLKYFLSKAEKLYNDRKQKYGAEIMSLLERKILLQNVDRNWMDHLDAMEELKRGIYLRSYGQQNPIVAFRMESYDMFEEMTDAIREGTVTGILTVVIRTEADTKREQQGKITSTSGATDGSEKKQPIKKAKKPGRNDPCPCGSGKKYKYCCGKDD